MCFNNPFIRKAVSTKIEELPTVKIAELTILPQTIIDNKDKLAALHCYACDVEKQATVYCVDCTNVMCSNHNEVSP